MISDRTVVDIVVGSASDFVNVIVAVLLVVVVVVVLVLVVLVDVDKVVGDMSLVLVLPDDASDLVVDIEVDVGVGVDKSGVFPSQPPFGEYGVLKSNK